MRRIKFRQHAYAFRLRNELTDGAFCRCRQRLSPFLMQLAFWGRHPACVAAPTFTSARGRGVAVPRFARSAAFDEQRVNTGRTYCEKIATFQMNAASITQQKTATPIR